MSIPPPPPPANHPLHPLTQTTMPQPPPGSAQTMLTTQIGAAAAATAAPTANEETMQHHHQRDSSGGDSGSLKFDVDLWDKFDDVFGRITRGRHDLKKIKAYMEERSEAEKQYGRALKKAHEVGELEEASSLTSCWKDLTTSGPNLSKQHEQFGVMCEEVALNLEKSIVDLKNTKTKLLLQFKKLVAERASRKEAHDKAKKSYADSIKVAEQAIQIRDKGAPAKQMEKVEANMRKSIKDVEACHILYKKSVSMLVESQKAHDAGVIDIMQQFEKLERARLRVLSEQLDRFAQSHEFLKSSLDQIAVFLKRGVTGINVSKDIQDYIAKNRTGAAHTPYTEYEPIRSPIIDAAQKGATGISSAGQNVGVGTVGASSSSSSSSASSSPPALVPLPTSIRASVDAGGGGGHGHGPARLPPPLHGGSFSSNPTPAAVPPHSTTPAPTPPLNTNIAVGLFDFDSTESDDLPFKAGDVINLTACLENEDWWQGELNGRTGMFPKNYVSKADAQGRFVGADGSVIGTIDSIRGAAAASPANATATTTAGLGGLGGAAASDVAAAAVPEEPMGGGGGGGDGDAPRLINATCVALYDFEGQDTDELSFKAGEKLVITGELNGWYLGRQEQGSKVGIFPSNYVNMSK